MKKASVSKIAEFINPKNPPKKLRYLWNLHRHLKPNNRISTAEILRRYLPGESYSFRFLFYNTFLLRAPLNNKPVIPYRAFLMGKEFERADYELISLNEVMSDYDLNKISNQSNHRIAIRHDHDTSGLAILSNLKIKGKKKIHVFENDGGAEIIDSWAYKGVLYTEIESEFGNLDLYTTHLMYGSPTLDIPPFMGVDSTPDPSEKKRTKYRILQAKEIRSFVEKTHKKENVAIIAGDFNIDANPKHEDFDAYKRLTRIFSDLSLKGGHKTSFEDLWLKMNGDDGGATNNPYSKCSKRYGDDIFCDDVESTNSGKDKSELNNTKQHGRIDYVWIEKPNDNHNFNLDTTVVRRRPFPLPNLTREEIYEIISEVGFHGSLKGEIHKRARDVANEITFYDENPVGRSLGVIFETLSQNDKILVKRHLDRLYEKIDFTQLFNNYLKRECRIHKRDKIGHLSDHIGLDMHITLSSKV